MSGLNQRTFTAAIASGFYDLACGESMSSFDSNLTDDEIEAMATEAASLPAFFFRNIIDWQRTRRATLFPKNNNNYPYGMAGRLLLPSSEDWAPNIHRFLNYSKWAVQDVARKVHLPRDIDSLLKWSPNRVGINLMRGEPEKEALIPTHTDPPEETGLVIALELIGPSAGKLSLIFSADVCATLGIQHPAHEVRAFSDRLSLTLAELQKDPPNPITRQ